MAKKFYKYKESPKIFFSPKLAIRSYAYGMAVEDNFIRWEQYYIGERRRGDAVYRLSATEGIPSAQPSDRSATSPPASSLPPLVLHSIRYTLEPDGCVAVNGRRTSVTVGTEVKAWAIMDIPTGVGFQNILLVISRPLLDMATQTFDSTTRLTGYEISRQGPTGKILLSIPYETVITDKSLILPLGQHIFTVHNSTLNYLYYRIEDGSFEEVPIGEDKDNASSVFCHYVPQNIVATQDGTVYWISDGDVYGIRIGHPKNLLHAYRKAREYAAELDTEGSTLRFTCKDRLTGQSTVHTYSSPDRF